MGVEIERKFLVQGDTWRLYAVGVPYRQGYIRGAEGRTLRVRIAGNRGYFTLKGAADGIRKLEFEYEIPLADAQQMLTELCDRPLIEKTRYTLHVEDTIWEVDEFEGDNAGLILAEVELSHEDQPFSRPDWLGEEVTYDGRYYNASLARNPYKSWASNG